LAVAESALANAGGAGLAAELIYHGK
jgi:hypothetical protein